MCQHISLRRSPPAILKAESKRGRQLRFAEIAGGTTAECVAICCCCPCSVFSILVLLALRLPAGLCRRALRKRILLRRAKKRAALVGAGSGGSAQIGAAAAAEGEPDDFAAMKLVMLVRNEWPELSPEADVRELEVWSEFSGGGFWRSPMAAEEEK